MTQVLPTAPDSQDPLQQPFQDVAQLEALLRAGCKTGPLKVGVEHEKFGLVKESLQPLEFDGPQGIQALLELLATRFGHARVQENGRTVALMRNGASISLEPGGQLELSGAPSSSLEAVVAEIRNHLEELHQCSQELGVRFVGGGFRTLPHAPPTLMPRARYQVMSRHLARTGGHGLDMMHSTATVQANLDFSSEADMGEKFQVALGISSLVTALFAASPFAHGNSTRRQSHRMHVWTDVDPTRCGLPSFALEAPPTFAAYAQWAMNVPIIFIRDAAAYQPAPMGLTLRTWLEGWEGLRRPLMSDVQDLLSTLFPDVRLKTYLEVRSADAGTLPHLLALPALWKGILYDAAARKRAWALVSGLSVMQHLELRAVCSRAGLHGTLHGLAVGDACEELCLAAQAGLRSLGSPSEAQFLGPMLERARARRSLADQMLAAGPEGCLELLALA